MRWDWFWYAVAALIVVNTAAGGMLWTLGPHFEPAFALFVAGLLALVGYGVAD